MKQLMGLSSLFSMSLAKNGIQMLSKYTVILLTFFPLFSEAIHNGVPNFNPRIVFLGNVKFQGTERELKFLNCTGVLYKPNIVITAVHCIDEDSTVLAFRVNKNNKIDSVSRILRIETRDSFNRFSGYDDIAIILLKDNLISDDLPPLYLSDIKPIEGLSVKSYGVQHIENETHMIPSSAHFEIVDDELYFKAKDKVKLKSVFEDDASKPALCYGDSGGPSIMEVDGKEYLVGILSFITIEPMDILKLNIDRTVKGCVKYSSRITSIFYHYDWINKTVDDLLGETRH